MDGTISMPYDRFHEKERVIRAGTNNNATTNNPLGYHQHGAEVNIVYLQVSISNISSLFFCNLIHQVSIPPYHFHFLSTYACIHSIVPSLPPLSAGHHHHHVIIFFAGSVSWCLIDHVGPSSPMYDLWMPCLPMPFPSTHHRLHHRIQCQCRRCDTNSIPPRELHQIHHS